MHNTDSLVYSCRAGHSGTFRSAWDLRDRPGPGGEGGDPRRARAWGGGYPRLKKNTEGGWGPPPLPVLVYRQVFRTYLLRLIMMGADAPIPPQARSSAAPDGAPPRRIKTIKSRWYTLAPPGPVRGPEVGRLRIFQCLLKKIESLKRRLDQVSFVHTTESRKKLWHF